MERLFGLLLHITVPDAANKAHNLNEMVRKPMPAMRMRIARKVVSAFGVALVVEELLSAARVSGQCPGTLSRLPLYLDFHPPLVPY